MIIRWLKTIFGLRKMDTTEDVMKYLIVGLGNIGSEYVGTRHNIGFEAVDAFIQAHEGSYTSERYGELSKVKYRGRQIILLKPNTYMNLSGSAIRYWLQKEKISVDRLLVIVDDLNLDFGHFRIRKKGSAGGHNGLKSIEQELGNTQYPRLRIGIGSDFSRGQQVDYVLGKWSEKEMEQLPKLLDRSVKTIESFVFRGMTETMNRHSGK